MGKLTPFFAEPFRFGPLSQRIDPTCFPMVGSNESLHQYVAPGYASGRRGGPRVRPRSDTRRVRCDGHPAAVRAQQLMGARAPKLAELTDSVLYADIWERHSSPSATAAWSP